MADARRPGSDGSARGVEAPAAFPAAPSDAPTSGAPACRSILGVRIDATSYERATDEILGWAYELSAERGDRGRAVYLANVHMVMEAVDDAGFRAILNAADRVTPDGVPLVWALRALGVRGATRVYGPTLMLHLCAAAAQAGVPIGLHGGSAETLAKLTRTLHARWPTLRVAYAEAPPFTDGAARPDPARDADERAAIADSGARIVFVGLGCPKQERWIARQVPHLPAVLLGVGAAFDFHASTVRQAPAWLQRAGMEWAFRLAMEPRRLARRYLRHNPRFVARFLAQWWREGRGRRG